MISGGAPKHYNYDAPLRPSTIVQPAIIEIDLSSTLNQQADSTLKVLNLTIPPNDKENFPNNNRIELIRVENLPDKGSKSRSRVKSKLKDNNAGGPRCNNIRARPSTATHINMGGKNLRNIGNYELSSRGLMVNHRKPSELGCIMPPGIITNNSISSQSMMNVT